jgi:NAD(P)-dependent dehydrogenase (short-subunit alcohol dehydrogenase family)
MIVTGVSQGFGEALALEMLGRGAQVLGIGRASSARLAGDAYHFVSCDLAQASMLPAITRGTRASSIRIESASSTIA